MFSFGLSTAQTQFNVIWLRLTLVLAWPTVSSMVCLCYTTMYNFVFKTVCASFRSGKGGGHLDLLRKLCHNFTVAAEAP